jgi:L-ascorbate metabolism protein UlaG (beta-lactamase superfamily)
MRMYITILTVLLIAAGCTSNDEVGKPYKGWKQGEFDIHHIHTGMGEANFFIMPDGTSMLIDSGDMGPNDPEWERKKLFPPMPECEFHPGKYVARYILRVNPSGDYVDYFMSSHFHDDHFGTATRGAEMTQGRNPDYVLSGLAETAEYIKFGKFYDRGYPDYDYPVVMNDMHLDNYRKVVAYHVRENGSVQEKFNVGELNQIGMTHGPGKYDDIFSIRNLAANGEVWTGEGAETIRYYDLNPANMTMDHNENTKSIAIRVDYGPFSYYTGGDLSEGVQDEYCSEVNIEAKVGEVCGEVDVCKTNHHAYKDAMTEDFVNAVNPDHYISCAWDIWHTQPQLMERMLARTDGMIFHQFVWPEFLEEHKDAAWYDRLYKDGGHIVVKAYDKGRSYKIYVLDSTNEDMTVKAVFGPYSAE